AGGLIGVVELHGERSYRLRPRTATAPHQQKRALPLRARLRARNGKPHSGGAGNCTRVPWSFSAGFYVCSLSSFYGPKPPRCLARSPTSEVPRSLSGCEV